MIKNGRFYERASASKQLVAVAPCGPMKITEYRTAKVLYIVKKGPDNWAVFKSEGNAKKHWAAPVKHCYRIEK